MTAPGTHRGDHRAAAGPSEPARYDVIGTTYAHYRVPDPRVATVVEEALRGAGTVIDVGSGTGSYEPPGRRVVAVEPSSTMIGQRPPDAAPVTRAVAERLPFRGRSFDAALAVLTVHHWDDPVAGLGELARVAPLQVVLTWDPAVFARFWLVAEYIPEIGEHEAGLATLAAVEAALRVREVFPVAVPWDCTDGFCGAYWRRPHVYLDPAARAAISAFSVLPSPVIERAIARLGDDLDDGTWARRHAELLATEELDLGYRLVIAHGRRQTGAGGASARAGDLRGTDVHGC